MISYSLDDYLKLGCISLLRPYRFVRFAHITHRYQALPHFLKTYYRARGLVCIIASPQKIKY